jgi:peptide/nickel transport system substrate-binding protein
MWIFCIQKGEKLSNFKGSKSWRLILLFSVFALVVVACGDTAEEEVVEETPETTAAPATTAAEAAEEAPSGPDGVYKMAIFSDPQTQNYWNYLDTETDVWTQYVMSGQAVSLFSISYPNYQLVTGVAAELVEASVDNGDGTWTYTVPMVEGYEWSNGDAITANDMVWTFNTVNDLGLLSNWETYYRKAVGTDPEAEDYQQGIVSLVALDDYTVEITLNFDAGLSAWQYRIAQSPFLNETYWSQFASDRETLLAASGADAPVAGAFVYDKVEQGAFYTWSYDADTMWFGGETTIYKSGTTTVWDNGVAPAINQSFGDTTGDSFTYSSGPFVGTVEFTLYSDQDAAYLAFQNGEVDFVLNPLGVKRNLWEELGREPGVETIANLGNGMRYMAFNTRVFPGSDKAFRQAVACISDKEFVLNNVLQGVAVNMDGQMPEALTAWVAPVTGVLADCAGLSAEERWNKSVEILQAAGWTATDWGSHPGGADRAVAPTGIKGPNGTTPPSDMLLYAPGAGYDPLRSTMSLFIADWMQQLGFDVTARPTGFSVIVDQVFTPENCEDWYFYMLGWGLTAFPDHPEAFFASYNDTCEGGYNTPGFNNAEFDALVGEFNKAKTVADAIAISQQMEAILFEELPYLVLFNVPTLEVYRGNVEFPFTDVLDGLTGTGGGYPSLVKVSS